MKVKSFIVQTERDRNRTPLNELVDSVVNEFIEKEKAEITQIAVSSDVNVGGTSTAFVVLSYESEKKEKAR